MKKIRKEGIELISTTKKRIQRTNDMVESFTKKQLKGLLPPPHPENYREIFLFVIARSKRIQPFSTTVGKLFIQFFSFLIVLFVHTSNIYVCMFPWIWSNFICRNLISCQAWTLKKKFKESWTKFFFFISQFSLSWHCW